MTNAPNTKHWHLEYQSDNVAYLNIDRLESKVNTISDEVLAELKTLCAYISSNPPKALVLQSSKSSGFIAGADVEQFQTIPSVKAAYEYLREGQMVMDTIESFQFPTIAVIEGFCMGGGLELALACRYRIAEEEKSRFGLPEVKVGIHPGWGGCIRLPKLIGTLEALSLILTGKIIDARSAFKLGMIDASVPKRNIKEAIQFYVKGNQNKPKEGLAKWMQSIKNFREYLFGFTIVRKVVVSFLKKQLSKKVQIEHYPAPYRVLDNWLACGLHSDKAYILEAQSVSELVMGETSKELVRVFFLTEKLKNLSKKVPSEVKHVHVIGAGVMGGDIAAWCALRGLTVSLQDQNLAAIAQSFKRAGALFTKQLRMPHLILKAKDRLIADSMGYKIAEADVIIEAIIENLEAKQNLFKMLEQKASKHAILATNTSTIPLDAIRESLNNKERLVGIHFFNPVAKMPLVEIVCDDQTSKQVVDSALSFVGKIDKLPLLVKSAPGFLVNRILMPYIMEGMMLLEEDISPLTIDKAATQFGMPMGPIELADTVGLDVCYYAARELDSRFENHVPSKLKKLLDDKQYGRKSGAGFYRYKNGALVHDKKSIAQEPNDDIKDRLFLRMLNESQSALSDQIVTEPDYLDAGMMFGTGFPFFRGGPIRYIETTGKEQLITRLLELETLYGARFKPNANWYRNEV